MDVSATLKGTDYLTLGRNLFVESVIDLALKGRLAIIVTFKKQQHSVRF